ncbi:hypothetical protein JW935_08720 [candidate division KSB1 bacterium]|nr:hypothetical protein [candidate division KSB1 bacterium]
MRYCVVVAVSAVMLVSGCASLSTYQSAKVLPENELSVGGALTGTGISLADDGENEFYENINFILPEFFLRASVSKNFDAGFKFFPLAGVVDGKYQFVRSNGFAMAADLGIGLTSLSIGDEKTSMLDLYPTLLFTFDLSEKVDLTFAPKLITRFISAGDEKDQFNMPGFTVTLSLGPIKPEIGFYTSEGVHFMTYGIAVAK